MAYREYLRWEGGCSLALGAALAVVAFPGLLVSFARPWAALAFVPVLLVALTAWGALRHGASPLRPGQWLTTRSLRAARPGREALPAPALRRRLLAETSVWVLAVCGWVVLTRSSGFVIFGTGLASAAFGAVQALAAPATVKAAERRRGVAYLVARRPGLGTPELTC